MANMCCVVGCHSNHTGKEIVPVLLFSSDGDIENRRIKFVMRKDWQPTSSAVIWIKHFEGKFLKKGEHEKRFRLIKTLKPIPTIHLASTKTYKVHLHIHVPHIKYLFQENLQRKEFFKKISIMNSKGTTILLVWKRLLNQAVHMVIFSPNMKIILFFVK